MCTNVEKAESKPDVKAAFKQLNLVVRILLEAAPGEAHDALARHSLCSFRLGERFRAVLQTATSVSVALFIYKEAFAIDLAAAMRAQVAKSLLDDEKDEEMLLRLLPVPSPLSEVELIPDGDGLQKRADRSGKKVFSAIDDVPVKPKKSSISALASLSRKHELIDHGCGSKKQALITREKLRSGLHDPRGLHKMVSSYTNALERAKKMEILKCAGYVFDENKNLPGETSFADKLQTAKTRLELGFGGHALKCFFFLGVKKFTVVSLFYAFFWFFHGQSWLFTSVFFGILHFFHARIFFSLALFGFFFTGVKTGFTEKKILF